MQQHDELEPIDTNDLTPVCGGLEASGKVSLPNNTSAEGSVKTTPPQAEPEKQLRCYAQVAKQAGVFQASAETLKQQLALCGPLRP